MRSLREFANDKHLEAMQNVFGQQG